MAPRAVWSYTVKTLSLSRGLPDHAECIGRRLASAPPAVASRCLRVSCACPARVGSGRGPVLTRTRGTGTIPRLRPGAAGVLGVPALQEASQVRLAGSGPPVGGGQGGRAAAHGHWGAFRVSPGVRRCHFRGPASSHAPPSAARRAGGGRRGGEPQASRIKLPARVWRFAIGCASEPRRPLQTCRFPGPAPGARAEGLGAAPEQLGISSKDPT